MNRKMHQKGKKLILLLGWLGLATCIFAQQHRLVFEEIGVKEGLPENYITDIIQDDLGFIWIGTQNGLVKYNGDKFRIFKPKDIPGLEIKGIRSLLKARDSRIWFGCWGNCKGISVYDPISNTFRTYSDTSDFVSSSSAYSILKEDISGNIWLMKSESLGRKPYLACFNEKLRSWTYFPYRAYAKYNPWTIHSGKFAESIADSSIWVVDEWGTLLRKGINQDSFSTVVEPGTAIPGTSISDTISSITALKDGKLVLNTRECILIWDVIQNTVVQVYSNHPNSTNRLATGNLVDWGVYQAEHGQIWVSHVGGNISLINIKTQAVRQFYWSTFLKKNRDLPVKVLFFIPATQSTQETWFEILDTKQNISYCRFNKQDSTFTFYNNQFNDPNNPSIPNFNRNKFLIDHNGLLWIGSRPHLFKQAPKSRQFDYFSNELFSENILPSDTTTTTWVDSRNWTWICTRKGLGRFEPDENKFTTFKHDPDDQSTIPSDFPWNVIEDSKGDTWITFSNGFAKYLPDTDNFRRFSYDPNPVSSENGIISFTEIDSNNFLFAIFKKGIFTFNKVSGKITPKYLLKDYEKNGLKTQDIYKMHLDSYGNLWVGNQFSPWDQSGVFLLKKGTNRFKKLNPIFGDKTSIDSKDFRFFHEDINGNLFIGTNGGINLYDRQKDFFHRFSNPDIASVHAPVKANRDNTYFITYSGAGLIKLDPDSLTYQSFSEKDGLLHNDVNSIWNSTLPADSSGRLWLPTERGLSVFDPKTETFINYTDRDGVNIDFPYFISVDNNNNIWVSGLSGLHRIDPVELMQKDSTLPNLVLTGLQINDQRYENPDSNILTRHISYTDAITLSHDQKNLTFEFVALHYLRPEDNQYSWKLVNYDDNWSEPSLERKATYTNLSPGTYTFRVKGANADGIWNEEGTSLQIIILPPWWATGWAYFLYAILIALAVYGIVQWRTRFLRKQRETLQTKVAEQTLELRQRNEDLRQAKEEAQAAEASAKEANETKSNFLSTVSHELRTPLTSVLGFTRIVRKRFTEKIVPALPKEDKSLDRTVTQIEKNLDVVVKEGDRLTNLINDVLDLAKIESGRTEWRMEDLNINTVIQHAHHATASLFESKDLAYREQLADNLPTVQGDQDKLIQVLVNLLSNAVKFTDAGSVTVSSSLENEQVVVRVRDTGIGIAAEDLPKVFEKFRQVGDTLTDKPQGTGLGLPICQEIIQHLGGDIWVDSTPGVGSTFGFALPTAKALASKGSHDKLDALLQELRRKIPVSEKFNPHESHQNILVVDDEAGIRELLRQELSDLGYQVTLAEDGQKALQSIRQKRPDMIILDVMMPELNGFDVAAILKNDPKTVDIPILILSIVQDKLRGFKIGVDRYLHKPIDMDRLTREVESLMNGGKSTKKILVVDEQDSAARTITKALLAQGYQVIEADMQRLLEMAKSNQPDAIILNASLDNQEAIVKALRFEKGLDSVLFLMYQ